MEAHDTSPLDAAATLARSERVDTVSTCRDRRCVGWRPRFACKSRRARNRPTRIVRAHANEGTVRGAVEGRVSRLDSNDLEEAVTTLSGRPSATPDVWNVRHARPVLAPTRPQFFFTDLGPYGHPAHPSDQPMSRGHTGPHSLRHIRIKGHHLALIFLALGGGVGCYQHTAIQVAPPPLADPMDVQVGNRAFTLHRPRFEADSALVGWLTPPVAPDVSGVEVVASSTDSSLVRLRLPLVVQVRELDRGRTALLALTSVVLTTIVAFLASISYAAS